MMTQDSCVICDYPEVAEETAPTYFRKDVNGFWSITVNPGLDVGNLVQNPSFELNVPPADLDGWGSDSGAVLSTITPGYRGVFALRVDAPLPGSTLIDVTYASLQAFPSPFPAIVLAPGEEIFAKVAVRGCTGDNFTLRILRDGIGPGAPPAEVSETVAATGDWQVLSASAKNINAGIPINVRLYVSSDNGSGCDGFDLDGGTMTRRDVSIFDGDSLFARWEGAVHASISTAQAGTRGWGDTINLSQYDFQLIGDEGFGFPPVQLITSNFARRAGASYQRMQTLPRTITLIGRIENSDPVNIHKQRHELIRDIGLWDITNCGQEFLLKFQYTDSCGNPLCEELEIPVEYSGGLEGTRRDMRYEQIIMQFVANEFPYWRSQNNQGRVLVNGANQFTYEGTAPAPVGLRFVGPMTLNSITNDTNNTSIFFGVPGPGHVIPAGEYVSIWTQPGQVIAIQFDQATGNPLAAVPINYANSQPGRFRLSPNAANRVDITLDVVGGTSTIVWFDTWLSADSALRNC